MDKQKFRSILDEVMKDPCVNMGVFTIGCDKMHRYAFYVRAIQKQKFSKEEYCKTCGKSKNFVKEMIEKTGLKKQKIIELMEEYYLELNQM